MKINKILRVTISMLIGIIFIGIGCLGLWGVYITAPTESLNWLKENPIFNILIIGTSLLSFISVSIKGSLDIYDRLDYTKKSSH